MGAGSLGVRVGDPSSLLRALGSALGRFVWEKPATTAIRHLVEITVLDRNKISPLEGWFRNSVELSPDLTVLVAEHFNRRAGDLPWVWSRILHSSEPVGRVNAPVRSK